jgi:hypothetical protein
MLQLGSKVTKVTQGSTCQGTFAEGYGGADADGYQGRSQHPIQPALLGKIDLR